MVEKTRAHLPHIILNQTSTTENYTSPRRGFNNLTTPIRDRQSHATKLVSQIESLIPIEKEIIEEQERIGIETRGIQVVFESDPELDLKLESLENQRSGIELCSAHLNEDNSTTATVFIPEGKIDYFLRKIINYRDNDGKPNRDNITSPQNQSLVESISEIKLAVLESLWTEDINTLPQNKSPFWWEVWIRLSKIDDHVSFFREHAQALGLRVDEQTITFVDRAVILAYGTKETMSRSVSLLGIIAELRAAKETASFFTGISNIEQEEWIEEANDRITVFPDINTYACILDSGINEAHPLLHSIADPEDMHSYEPGWGTHDGHENGHGTPMAGIVAYGDLTELLETNISIDMRHKLESVKILPNSGQGQNDPRLYGAITRESIGRVEIDNPDRKRIFCMAVTTAEGRDRGKPSSWSAMVDAITSGAEDENQRLIILSAGNADPASIINYPTSNFSDAIHDPGQSWNALTVGGYTEKYHIYDPEFSDYEPLAPFGDLAPSSCTSITWNKNWPFKPDIVMEAGNIGIDNDISFISDIDDLELLSTNHSFNEKSLVNFKDTSASTAMATRLAAILQAEYPEFWPETLRALIVHSAEWTDSLKSHFDLPKKIAYQKLLKFCGYGVPNPEKLFWSTNNSLTLIAQDSLQPFCKIGSDIKTQDINLHELPWPEDILNGLGDTEVEMKVTLSYFIEPNPGQRGWSTKYQYASHRLQFDVRRPLESVHQFKQRINKNVRDEDFNSKNNVKDSGEWVLGPTLRSTGSIHSDTWVGAAAELSQRKYIAIYPLAGWWKELKNLERWGNQSRYALVVSITTPETDIYTEVFNQIEIQNEIIIG